MTRRAKVLLFVMVTWKELVDAGLAYPLREEVNPAGIALYDQIEAEGFRPTDVEMKQAVEFLKWSGITRGLK